MYQKETYAFDRYGARSFKSSIGAKLELKNIAKIMRLFD